MLTSHWAGHVSGFTSEHFHSELCMMRYFILFFCLFFKNTATYPMANELNAVWICSFDAVIPFHAHVLALKTLGSAYRLSQLHHIFVVVINGHHSYSLLSMLYSGNIYMKYQTRSVRVKSRSAEASRLHCSKLVSLCNLPAISIALLPRRLANSIPIGRHSTSKSRLRDFARSYD